MQLLRLTLRAWAQAAACFLTTQAAVGSTIEHGTISVTEPFVDASSLSLSPTTTSGVSIRPASNFGDYELTIDPPGGNNQGIVISTVAENSRDGVRYPSVSSWYGSSSFHYLISLHEPRRYATTEDNANVAFAHFNYVSYDCGRAYNAAGTNGGTLDTFSGSAGIFLGAEFVDNNNGTYTLDLTLFGRPDRHSSLGVLLVNAAKNENNFALSRANADGSFTIFGHDNGDNGAVYEKDPVSFVYIPINTTKPQIKALGRIDGSGNPIISKGDFTVTKVSTNGTYYLQIPGHTNDTGTLLLSPEGGGSNNVDNTWSYEWNHVLQAWEIHSRDIPPESSLPSTAPQHIPSGEPAFSFVFIGEEREIIRVDPTAAPGGDGSTWALAYQDLQSAIAAADALTDIWVAEGTYKPGLTRDDTFQLKPSMRIYGGFPNGGGDGTFSARDSNPDTNNTVLSGDLDDDGTWAGNAYQVVDASTADQTSALDGFTLTMGSADGSDDHQFGGGIYLNQSTPTLSNLRIIHNQAILGGGMFMRGVDIITEITRTPPTLTNLQFLGNRATGYGGGAAYIITTARPRFESCSFIGNSSNRGAVTDINLTESTFNNCTFTANVDLSGSNAAGLYADLGAIPRLQNCIFWNNTGTDIYSLDVNLASANNLVQDGVTALPASVISTADPLFLTAPSAGDGDWTTFADNNYGDLDIPLISPARDAGLNTGVSAGTDLAGRPRISNFLIDLGAYELPKLAATISNAPPAPANGVLQTVADWIDVENVDGAGPYTYTITLNSSTGDLAFDTFPNVQTDGSLQFAITPNTKGFAFFSLVISDPSGEKFTSDTYAFQLRSAATQLFVDTSSTGDANGSGWGNAFNTIDAAISAAVSGDSILIAEGTYIGSYQLVDGTAVYGGFPTGGSSFEIRDPDAYPTVLSGDNSQRIFTGSALSGVTIEGLSFSNGLSTGPDTTDRMGGAILLTDNSVATLRNLQFTNNIAKAEVGVMQDAKGGAVAISGGTVEVIDCQFTGNKARGVSITGCHGGAIYAINAALTVTDCTFTGNRVEQHERSYFSISIPLSCGGAISAVSSTLTTSGNTFTSNQAKGPLGKNGYSSNLFGSAGANGQNAGSDFGATTGGPGGSGQDAGDGFNGGYALGGAIYIESTSNFSVSESFFEKNTSLAGLAGVGGTGGNGGRGGKGGNGASSINSDAAKDGGWGGNAGDGGQGGDGGHAYGGAIYTLNTANGTITTTTFKENTAIGGNAGAGGNGGNGGDGGDGGTASDIARNGGNGGHAGNGGKGEHAGYSGDAFGGAHYFSNSQISLTDTHLQGNYTKAGQDSIGGAGGSGGMGGDGGDGDDAVLPLVSGGDGGDGGNGGHSGSSAGTSRNMLFTGFSRGGAIFLNDSTLTTTNVALVGNVAHEPNFIDLTHPDIDGGQGGLGGWRGSSDLGADGEWGSDGNDGSDGTQTGLTSISTETAGGAIYALGDSPILATNITMIHNQRVATVSSGSGADFSLNTNAGHLTLLKNCIVSNNTISPSSSLDQQAGDSIRIDPTSSHNLIAIDPLFQTNPNSGDGDWTTDGDNNYGDLRLQLGSPAIDSGENAANNTALDIEGNSRIAGGTIDIGAYEFYLDFALLHAGLDPDADENGNGVKNYLEYAAGLDPTGNNSGHIHPTLIGNNITFYYRNNATDVFANFEKSTNLSNWIPLEEGVDYTLESMNTVGAQTQLTLGLIYNIETTPKQFYQGKFSTTE